MKLRHYLYSVPLLLAAACTGGSHGDSESGRRPVVTVSIAPQAWLLEAIGGDSIDINVLLETGANPETFEPGVGVMKKAAASDALMLSGGLTYETQLADRLRANDPTLRIVDTSAGIVPVYGTHSHGGHVHDDGVPDPHTWTSVRNARTIASNMLSALVEIAPGMAPYFTARARRLDLKLDSLDRAIAARLDTLPTRTFLVWHPSLSYFARDYGLEQVSVASEGRESTVQGIRSIVDHAAGARAQVLFIQADFDSGRAATLSRETGTRTVTINPLDPDWEKQIKIITDALDPR